MPTNKKREEVQPTAAELRMAEIKGSVVQHATEVAAAAPLTYAEKQTGRRPRANIPTFVDRAEMPPGYQDHSALPGQNKGNNPEAYILPASISHMVDAPTREYLTQALAQKSHQPKDDQRSKLISFIKHYATSPTFKDKVDNSYVKGAFTPEKVAMIDAARSLIDELNADELTEFLAGGAGSSSVVEDSNLTPLAAAVGGAVVGGAIGSAVGGVGAIPGSVIGAGVGLVGGFTGAEALTGEDIKLMPEQRNTSQFPVLLDQILSAQTKVGPNDDYVVPMTYTQDGTTAAIDAYTGMRELESAYFESRIRDLGVNRLQMSEPELQEVVQWARNRAGKDMIQVFMSTRNTSDVYWYDPVDAKEVTEMAELPAGVRSLRATADFRVSEQDAYAPTTKELAEEEGFFDYIMRLSPLDYGASHMKLLREHVDEQAMTPEQKLSYYAMIVSTSAPKGPVAGLEARLEEFGVTPEEQVHQFLLGASWLEEATQTAMFFTDNALQARGMSVEDAQEYVKEIPQSRMFALLAFAPYLIEPDAFSIGTGGLGKLGKVGVTSYRTRKLSGALDLADELAASKHISTQEALEQIGHKHFGLSEMLKAYVQGDLNLGLDDIKKLESEVAERSAKANAAGVTAERAVPGFDVNSVDEVVSQVIRGTADTDGIQKGWRDTLNHSRVSAAKSQQAVEVSATRLKGAIKALRGEEKMAAQMNNLMDDMIKKHVRSQEIAKMSPQNQATVVMFMQQTKMQDLLAKAKKAGDKKAVARYQKAIKILGQNIRRMRPYNVPVDELQEIYGSARKQMQTLDKLREKMPDPRIVEQTRKYVSGAKKAHADRVATAAKEFSRFRAQAARWHTLQAAIKKAGGKLLPDLPEALVPALKDGYDRYDVQKVLKKQQKSVNDLAKKLASKWEAKRAAEWRDIMRNTSRRIRASMIADKKGIDAIGFIRPRSGIRGITRDVALAHLSDSLEVISSGFPKVEVKVTKHMMANGATEFRYVSEGGINATLNLQSDGKFADLTMSIPRKADGTPMPIGVDLIGDYSSIAFKAMKQAIEMKVGFSLADVPVEVEQTMRQAGLPMRRGAKNQLLADADRLADINLESFYFKMGDAIPNVKVDGKKLYEALKGEYGDAVIDEVLKRESPVTDMFERIIRTEDGMLTLKEAERFQFEMAEQFAREAALVESGGIPLARMAITAEIFKPMGARRGILEKTLFKWGRQFLDQFDAFGVRIGEGTEESKGLLRSGENLSDQKGEELRQGVMKAGRANNGRLIDFIRRYVDTNEELDISGGQKTVMNSGRKTQWELSKRQILADAEVGSYLKDPKNVKIYEHSADLEKAMEANHPALLGLSRMWLGKGVNYSPQDSKKLYLLAAKNVAKANSYDEFAKMMREATEALDKDMAPGTLLRADVGRSYYMGARAVLFGATIDELTYTARRAYGGIFTNEQASDIRRLFSHDGKVMDVKNVENAFRALHEAGIPFTQRILKPAVASSLEEIMTKEVKLARQLVEFGTDSSGKSVLIANSIRRELSKVMNKHIKELDGYNEMARGAMNKAPVKALRTAIHYLNVSVTQGLILMNPKHMMFNYFGDSSQIFFEDGLKKMGRVMFQNTAANIPFFGNHIQDAMSRMSKRLAEGTIAEKVPVLRSLTESVMNPHINDFWNGGQGWLRMGEKGPLVSYDFLRRRATEDGILDVFANEELASVLRDLPKTVPLPFRTAEATADFIRHWQESLHHYVSVTQQRQRIGTWMMHLHDGKSFEKAQELTLNSLYDWKHGMSRAELLHLFRPIPFYRFWRLAMGRQMSMFLDPISKPTVKMLKDSATGQTRLNRLRVLLRAKNELLPRMDLMSYYWDDRDPEDIVNESAAHEQYARAFSPEWARGNPILGVHAMARSHYWKTREVHGGQRSLTHEVALAPPLTPIDAQEQLNSVLYIMSAISAFAVGEDIAGKSMMRHAMKNVTGIMYPGYREVFEDMLGLRYSSNKGPNDQVPITEGEAFIIRKTLPFVEVGRDQTTGRPMVQEYERALFRVMPLIGTQLPKLANDVYYKNPEFGVDNQKAIIDFTKSWIGIVRTYQFDPDVEHAKQLEEMTKILEQKKRKLGLHQE